MDKYRNITIAGKSYNYDALRRLMIRFLDEEVGNMDDDQLNDTYSYGQVVDDFIMRVEAEHEPEGDGYYWNETDPKK